MMQILFRDLPSLPVNLENWVYWTIIINEKSDFGIAFPHPCTSCLTRDSIVVLFQPSNMKIISDTSISKGSWQIEEIDIKPEGTQMALYMVKFTLDQNTGEYKKETNFELWDTKSFSKIQNLPYSSGINKKVLYSPDGSVLGYQHDGKLTLYSTTDYSVVWESPIVGNYFFNWSPDMSNLYLSTGFDGMYKINYPKKEIEHNYSWVVASRFINFDKLMNYILVGNGTIGLLDNKLTSIRDNFFDKFKINVFQDQTTNEFSFKINAPEPAVGNYTISNMLGEIMQNPLQINISEGTNQFVLSTADFPTGIYFLTLTLSGRTETLKFAVVR